MAAAGQPWNPTWRQLLKRFQHTDIWLEDMSLQKMQFQAGVVLQNILQHLEQAPLTGVQVSAVQPLFIGAAAPDAVSLCACSSCPLALRLWAREQMTWRKRRRMLMNTSA